MKSGISIKGVVLCGLGIALGILGLSAATRSFLQRSSLLMDSHTASVDTIELSIQRSTFIGEIDVLEITHRGNFAGLGPDGRLIDSVDRRIVEAGSDASIPVPAPLAQTEPSQSPEPAGSSSNGVVPERDLPPMDPYTEYRAQVTRVIFGDLVAGDVITLRMAGHAPIDPKNVERNRASAVPMTLPNDHQIVSLAKVSDGAYVYSSILIGRMNYEGGQLKSTLQANTGLKTETGDALTLEIFEGLITKIKGARP